MNEQEIERALMAQYPDSFRMLRNLYDGVPFSYFTEHARDRLYTTGCITIIDDTAREYAITPLGRAAVEWMRRDYGHLITMDGQS